MGAFPVAQVRADRICIYNEFEGHYPKRGKNLLSLKNLTNRKYKGELSKVSKKEMETRLIAWGSAVNEGRIKSLKTWDGNRLRMVMITLTLPSEQIHSDKDIKRLMLNHFLIIAKRKWLIDRYIWKGEAQQNGNLHFHIIVDRYIPKEDLQGVWNSIMARHGYIDKFEAKHGHRNPPSTDISQVRSLEQLSTYVQKYMVKNDACRLEAGAVWGCSDNLKHLKSPTLYLDNEVSNFISACHNDPSTRVVKKDNCTLIFGQILHIMKSRHGECYRLWREGVEEIWKKEICEVPKHSIIPEVTLSRTGLSVCGSGIGAVGLQLTLPWW